MKVNGTTLFVGILIFGSATTQAQGTAKTKAIDTLAYLRKVEMNKDKYIGKSFSVLLKNMIKMQPKMAKSTYNNDANSPITSTSFRFSEKDFDIKNQYTLIVKWKPDNIPTEPIQFTEEGNFYRFTTGYQNLLDRKVVKDITVIDKQ